MRQVNAEWHDVIKPIEWRRWFAWRPVKVQGRWVWLEWVAHAYGFMHHGN